MRKEYDFFRPELKRTAAAVWLWKLVPIPVGLLTAQLMAQVVDAATCGNTRTVLSVGGILAGVMLAAKLLLTLGNIGLERAKSRSLHRCSMKLYRQFLSNPLHALYDSEHGTSMEKLHDDFKTVTGYRINRLPGFWIGILTAVAYAGYLGLHSLLVAGILLGISLLQILPPVIVKKYMQVNYENCRQIEAKLTNWTVSAYRGFAAIRLYGLKQWWLAKFSAYHKEYLRIGNLSTLTGTAESSMYEFVDAVLKYGTYAVLGLLILSGKTTLDVGVQAIALSAGLFEAVKSVFSAIPEFGIANVAAQRLSDWFEPVRAEAVLQDSSVQMKHVSCVLYGKAVFQNANASFDAEKLCVIKGRNGAGKSTLFHLITGLIPCSGGQMTVGGAESGQLRPESFPWELFYLPQEDAQFSCTPRELYDMVDAERLPEFLILAEKFGLSAEQLEHTKIRELSGGERKKVYLVLALGVNPKFLLLDEPTNSLDEQGKQVLKQLLENRGALIITHDPVFDDAAQMIYAVAEGGITVEKAG